DDDAVAVVEWPGNSLLAQIVVALALYDHGGERELVVQLLAPLFAERRGHDQQDAALALGPALRDDETRLDGLAEADFIGKQHALSERRGQREQRGVHLMRIHIDARG